MDNIDILANKIKDLQKLAYQAQHPSNVGAQYGVISAAGSVQVGAETLQAYFACDAPNVEGTPVWIQRDGKGGAVIMGVAF